MTTLSPEAVEAYLDGRLDAPQRAALASQLAADAELASAFVAQVQQAQLLQRWYQAGPDQTEVIMARVTATRDSRRLSIADGVDRRLRSRGRAARSPTRGSRRRPQARSKVSAWVAVVALLVVAGAGWFWWVGQTTDAPTVEVLAVTGDCRADGVRLVAGAAVGDDAITVADKASLTCRLPDGTRITAASGSRWQFTDGGSVLDVQTGRLQAEVRPRGSVPLQFRSTLADAVVLGTTLTFTVQEDQTRLDVAEGRVQFTHQQVESTVMVAAGQWSIARPGQALVVEPRQAQVQADAVDLVVGAPPRFARGELGRVFKEPPQTEVGGPVLALPLAEPVELTVPVTGDGPWYGWIEWRDDSEDTLRFALQANGQDLGVVEGRRSKQWFWHQFTIADPGPIRLQVTAESLGRPARPENPNLFDYPYGFVVRIGAIVVTDDPTYVPPKDR